eukprot:TRINITY_DN3036_c0_g2_i3.p1 TRINITY_DN3036_c0_g2~~TRINITY_DN3036_c0_g2_i3.p1  ORF type:complete len:397 (+),score=77.17 TRINITY_DN3036_c0_g2_i3:60-1250(+)
MASSEESSIVADAQSQAEQKIASNDISATIPLAQLFYSSHSSFIELKDASSNDPATQEKVKQVMTDFLTLYYRTQQMGVFSSNETLDDVSTADLKYVLVPYFLGEICLKIVDQNREQHLKASQRFFDAFLKHCQQLEIITKQDLRIYQRGSAPVDAETRRNEKIDRTRRKKAAETKFQLLLERMKSRMRQMGVEAGEEAADDFEEERVYLRSFLDFAVLQTLDNLRMNQEELQILQMRSAYEEATRNNPQPDQRAKPKVVRIEPRQQPGPASAAGLSTSSIVASGVPASMAMSSIDSRVAFRSQYRLHVFKEFNPPTMDEDAYLDMLERQGFFAQAHSHSSSGSSSRQKSSNQQAEEAEEEEEESEEAHDRATLKARDWDNWKDDHEKGGGNKMRN